MQVTVPLLPESPSSGEEEQHPTRYDLHNGFTYSTSCSTGSQILTRCSTDRCGAGKKTIQDGIDQLNAGATSVFQCGSSWERNTFQKIWCSSDDDLCFDMFIDRAPLSLVIFLLRQTMLFKTEKPEKPFNRNGLSRLLSFRHKETLIFGQ